MSYKTAIKVSNLDKCYQLYEKPSDRLKQFLWGRHRQFFKEFWALRDINFEIKKGEVVGIIGRNGAGKSTLLQLICGTLTPSYGEVTVNGRVAALLELGAGFNPDFTGRENVFMNASIMGMNHTEIAKRFDEIVDFSGIREFIDQPVKTYSSGMYMRLAFSIAINVDPDILVIDEALSVGDGAFARQSFDRIMKLKEAGKTILFCSHSMYQIDVLCDRAIWLNKGQIEMIDIANIVTNKYNLTLIEPKEEHKESKINLNSLDSQLNNKSAIITNIRASVNGIYIQPVKIISEKSIFSIEIQCQYDHSLPTPSIAITFCTLDGICISSTSTYHDNINISEHLEKNNPVTVTFPSIPLLQGEYMVNIYLCCEKALHVYDSAIEAIQLHVTQKGTEQGFVMLPRHWNNIP